MILDAIEWALKAGCNSSLVEVIRSEDFQLLANVCANLEGRFPPHTDEGVALRTGHLNMGRLLNTLPEAEAISQARKGAAIKNASDDNLLRVLVFCLGQALVKAAQNCLPPDILDLASQWKTASADQQINIARQLFFAFRCKTQEAEGTLTMEVVREKMERKLAEVDDERNVLPVLYGMWDKEKCLANCQGKTQMFIAFGRLAGARALCVSPVRHCRNELREYRERMYQEMIADLRQRNLEDADAEMAESILASRVEKHLESGEEFHVGAALELRDGRWVLIDPHGLAWGVFPDTWDLSNTCRILEKYALVLPGLQLIKYDGGRSKQVLDQRLEEGRGLIERSRKMEKIIQTKVKELMDLADVVADSEDFDILMGNEMAEEGLDPPDLSHHEMRHYAAMMLVFGDRESQMRELETMMADRNFDYLGTHIRKWLTFYHVSAVNLFGNQLNDQGKLLHPVCEFGLPEYHIAISVVNSLTQRIGHQTSAAHRFFLDNSFDQVSLYNALSDREVGQAAELTLKALPFVHSSCRWKLDRLL